MIQTAKNLLRWVLKKIPFKSRIVVAGAAFSPALKTRTVMRLLIIIAESCPKEMLVSTNLGMAREYDVLLFNYNNELYLFGRPEYYLPERGALLLARELTKHATAFVDIGSHKGYYVFYIREGNHTKPIFFFEPLPELFQQIEQNVKRNHLEKVMGFKVAVGAQSGKTQFFIDKTSLLEGSLKEYAPQGHEIVVEDVDIVTFDDFISNHQLTDVCVKVDIEHAEFDFLNGSRNSLDHISYLVMEVLDRAIEAGFVQTMIEDFCFHAYYINDYSLEYTSDGSFMPVPPQYNWLFCRLAPTELKYLIKHTPFTIVTN